MKLLAFFRSTSNDILYPRIVNVKNLKRYCGIVRLKKVYSRSEFYEFDICAFYAFDK